MKRLRNGLKMKLKVFSQKFVGMVGFPAISPNEKEYNQCRLLKDELTMKYTLNFNF